LLHARVRLRWFDVAIKPQQLIVLEQHDDAPLLDPFAAFLHYVNIIPAIGVERIDDERRPECKSHLRPRHARLQLRHHILRHVITLLNVHSVRRQPRQNRDARAAREQEKHRN
jgi:hypothetical protein